MDTMENQLGTYIRDTSTLPAVKWGKKHGLYKQLKKKVWPYGYMKYICHDHNFIIKIFCM